jgi:hypothetical protein
MQRRSGGRAVQEALLICIVASPSGAVKNEPDEPFKQARSHVETKVRFLRHVLPLALPVSRCAVGMALE